MTTEALAEAMRGGVPVTVLAPMQDVTTLPFMRLLADARYGAPDFFVTEFLRVHATSIIDEDIRECLENPPAGTPLFLQLIGEDVPALVRVAREALSRFDVAGIDLNLGCPAPKVFRKNVGGGLLRDLPHVAEILPALREVCSEFGRRFTLKCRLGFDDAGALAPLLDLARENAVDWIAVHGRTVRGLYRTPVDYDAIAAAVRDAACPVLANGEISSVEKALRVREKTRCAGWMIGRHAIRNPWIFRQLRETREGAGTPFAPRLGDVFDYVRALAGVVALPGDRPERVAARMKKFLNFVGTGADAEGAFLHAVRRAETPDEIFAIADRFLLAGGNAEKPFPEEPFPGLVARPNCEA